MASSNGSNWMVSNHPGIFHCGRTIEKSPRTYAPNNGNDSDAFARRKAWDVAMKQETHHWKTGPDHQLDQEPDRQMRTFGNPWGVVLVRGHSGLACYL